MHGRLGKVPYILVTGTTENENSNSNSVLKCVSPSGIGVQILPKMITSAVNFTFQHLRKKIKRKIILVVSDKKYTAHQYS